MKYDIDSIKRRKEINNRIKKIIFIFLVIMLYNIVLLYMSYIDKFDTPSFYIYKAYLISTESMEPEIKKGDAIVIKKVKEDQLKVNDIVTFKINEEVITHRIVKINDYEEGKTYITKGDNNNVEDPNILTFEDIEGKQIIKIPYLGKMMEGLKNGIIIILVILISLIIYLNRIGMKEKSEARREKKKLKTKNLLAKNKIKKEIVNVLRKILKYICAFIGVCLITYNILYLYNNTFKDKKYAQIFNLYISTEKETSMSPAITKNSLIIGCKIKEKHISQNEIVGYDIDNSIKYHRLMKIKRKDGKVTYITKADNNYREDIEEKQKSDLKARIVVKIPVIGWLFRIFESKITTVVIILLLCLKFSYNNYKIKISKKRKSEKEELKP